MNDENGLSERLQTFAAAVWSTPSLVDGVMRRVGEAPPPVRRRSRWKLIAAACLATVAFLVVSVVGWMTIDGDDPTKTASVDGTRDAMQPAKAPESEAADAADSTLFERHSSAGVQTRGEGFRNALGLRESRGFDDGQKQRERGSDNLSYECRSGKKLAAAFAEASRSEPELSDFAGLWRGTAVDKPEDGTSTNPLGIKLTISAGNRLEGVAFDDFARSQEARLEDVYVVGDRLEFKVRHHTGVQMWVTLGLAGNTLKGDGIPIRSDQSRCDIVLQRQPPELPPREREAEPSKP